MFLIQWLKHWLIRAVVDEIRTEFAEAGHTIEPPLQLTHEEEPKTKPKRKRAG